jgi:cytochrome c551/c552
VTSTIWRVFPNFSKISHIYTREKKFSQNFCQKKKNKIVGGEKMLVMPSLDL